MMTAFTRRQCLGGLAVMMGAILVATALAHAAKCIPDPDSASYQDPSAPGYNDQYLIDVVYPQLAGEPYFGVALNTPPLSSGDSSLRDPDTARNETIPPQSWWRPSLVLTWDRVSATAQYRLKLEDPPYSYWIAYDKSWFNENSRTVSNEASMQRWWRVEYRESADDTPKTLARIFIRCGVEVVGVPPAGLRASFTSTPIAPHVSTGEPEYGDRYLAWNREVNRILTERQETPPTTAPSAPTAPQNLTGVGGDGEVALSWDAPRNNGGALITDYQYRIDGSGAWVSIGATATTHTVSGLVNGTTYAFEVRAVNANGTGAVAAASATPVAPATAPLAPQNLTATPGEGQVTLTWTAGDDGGSAVTQHQYRQQAGSDAYGPWTDIPGGAHASRYTVTGLANGTTYTFEVRAVNAKGAGAAAKTSATPTATAPLAPQNLTATPGESQVTLVWTAGDDGGSAVTQHQYRQQAGSDAYGPWTDIPGGANASRFTVTGLVNGTTYTFEVRAVNAEGAGAAAEASATPAATATAPLAPANLTATPGEDQVTLSWSAGDDGGSSVARHQYRHQAGSGDYGPWTDIPGGANATRFTVTGLVNGTTYTFEVRAVNAKGAGAAAAASVTLAATAPLAPVNLTATPGESQVTLAWSAGDDGGSRVTRHQYRHQAGSGGYGPWTDIPDSAPGGAHATHFTVTGLVNGTTYTFEVRAVNAVDAGAVAEASATPEAPTAWRWGWRHWGGWWPRMQ